MNIRNLQSLLVCSQNPLNIFPHKGRMNFWLTVLTGISDPRLCLALDVHSLHAVICVPLREESED